MMMVTLLDITELCTQNECVLGSVNYSSIKLFLKNKTPKRIIPVIHLLRLMARSMLPLLFPSAVFCQRGAPEERGRREGLWLRRSVRSCSGHRAARRTCADIGGILPSRAPTLCSLSASLQPGPGLGPRSLQPPRHGQCTPRGVPPGRRAGSRLHTHAQLPALAHRYLHGISPAHPALTQLRSGLCAQ